MLSRDNIIISYLSLVSPILSKHLLNLWAHRVTNHTSSLNFKTHAAYSQRQSGSLRSIGTTYACIG